MQLPTLGIKVYAENTKVILFLFIPYTMLSAEAKLRACYFHACITYIIQEPMNNSSLRKRFRVDEKNHQAYHGFGKKLWKRCLLELLSLHYS